MVAPYAHALRNFKVYQTGRDSGALCLELIAELSPLAYSCNEQESVRELGALVLCLRLGCIAFDKHPDFYKSYRLDGKAVRHYGCDLYPAAVLIFDGDPRMLIVPFVLPLGFYMYSLSFSNHEPPKKLCPDLIRFLPKPWDIARPDLEHPSNFSVFGLRG